MRRGAGCSRSCGGASTSSVRVRRAMIIMASASGTPVPAIARLVAADEDTVRDVIHAFNERGLAALDPQWAGGRPRLISDDESTFIVATATTRPKTLGLPVHPLERPQARRLPAPTTRSGRVVRRRPGTAAAAPARRTRSPSSAPGPGRSPRDPDKDAKLDRIEQVTSRVPGPVLRLRPVRAAVDPAQPRHLLGTGRASPTGCRRPTTAPTASATSTAATASATTSCGASSAAARAATTPWPRSSRSAPPARTAPRSTSSWTTCPRTRPRRSAPGPPRNKVELCFTPTSASWANPIEAQFGPLRSSPWRNSNHPNHTVLARELQAYLRWRNANARHPDVLAAQRRERARIRSERRQRWGRPKTRRLTR